MITRRMFEALDKLPDFRVIIAGPGETVEAVAIRSKLSPKAIRNYRKLLRNYRPDVTFSPSTSGLSTMLIASVGLGIRNIGYRGTQARVRRTDPFNYLALLNPRVNHVVCETQDIAESLGTVIGKDKVSVATKPFMLEWVAEAMASPAPYPGKQNDSLKLITIGMFDGRPHKGLSYLLDSMRMIVDLPVELTVVGSVSDHDRSTAPDNVIFTGPRKDAINLLPVYDLYVLPSLRDASPRTVRESQACGVPCIVTDIPGARDLIAPGNTGVLVPPSDASALAKCIAELSADRNRIREMAQRTRPYIAENFDMDSYVQFHANLFHK